MTANYVAKVVESFYNKIDIDKMSEGFDKIKKYDSCGRVSDEWTNRQITDKRYIRWCFSISVLEEYMRKNYTTFTETELVYKWGKRICEQRNKEYNQWRVFGGYTTFEQWLKKNRR
jgi:hypothetical protein